MSLKLKQFVAESNRIEGIHTSPKAVIDAHKDFLEIETLEIQHLIDFVGVIQPNARFRNMPHVHDVRVGRHIAPPSGPNIEETLNKLLNEIRKGNSSPFDAHVCYETLHPFTDGNGRSGRALWLWHMKQTGKLQYALMLGFLHAFYYQTLDTQQNELTW